MNKLESFKKISAAFFKAATDESVVNAADKVQDATNIADALERFADALDLHNTPGNSREKQNLGEM